MGLKYHILLIIIILKSFVLQAKPLILSQNTETFLLTYSTGDDLYTFFGHSAIRIKDDKNHFDKVYNYGTFDFNTPHFYVKFVRGVLLYKISREDFSSEVMSWKYLNRSVLMQKMNLSHNEIQNLYENLETNYLPENRDYKYDIFFDNCATRIRDIIEQSLNHPLIWNFDNLPKDQTFRTLIHPCVQNNTWLMLGIDLILGAPTDKNPKPEEYMYLPEHLQTVFSDAKIQNDSNTVRLLNDPVLLYHRNAVYIKRTFPKSWQFFWGLFVAIVLITIYEYVKKDYFKWIDVMLFGITGIFGFFILFLWFCTEHVCLEKNMSLLWAFPVNLFVAIQIIRNKIQVKWISYYLTIFMVLMIIDMLFSKYKFPSLFPIVLMLTVRSLVIYFSAKKIINK